ncbi:MATE family efflux transporter [Conexibacter sp. DBS9H8]|uniref:MATE family efflux transporter n=1 Tax=Conexibacter sp. DBS9H8 TaxID=2937801 RepID=UPI00200E68FE|nr:MATE family efflux transporter [Conexibacter sp. DBS9H8]
MRPRAWSLLGRYRPHPDDRRILFLALPALGALAAEPLYVLVDTGIVGHLGVAPLAALALAGTVIATVTTLCNFLEYGSTPTVGARYARGDITGARALGNQALLLAGALGVLLAALLALLAGPVIAGLGGTHRTGELAVRYLRISSVGLPFNLMAVAASGYFRGIARLRSPLVILVLANLLNALLEFALVDGLGWGITGSAAGTVLTQILTAAWYARAAGFSLVAPRRHVLAGLAGIGAEIFVRSAALYASFLLAGALLARIGSAALAAHQIVFGIWNALALILDALAIAAQVLISHALTAGATAEATGLARRVIVWSVAARGVLGAGLLALEPVLIPLFSSAPRVVADARAVWPICALMQPLNGAAFALDGILIGARDTRYLMWAMLPCTLVVFLPLALLAFLDGGGITGIWLAILAFIGARTLLTGWRLTRPGWTRAAAAR